MHTALPEVILINDDPMMLDFFSVVLEDFPSVLRLYSSAPDAIHGMSRRFAEKGTIPDIVITDLYMPEIDGWKLCRLLRSGEYRHFNEVPILVVSATFTGEDPDRITRELGANGFLTHPVDRDFFLHQVNAVISGSSVRQMPRVLVVDDDPNLILMLRKVFEANGYELQGTDSIEKGIAAFNEDSFNIVILDYHLPDGTGEDLLRWFHAEHPETVYVMMTFDSNPEFAVSCMRSGASSYVRKPASPEYVLTVCENASRERALLRVEEHLERRTREVKTLLHQRETLLKEIHHRVKNNMNAVAGLLSLQIQSETDPNTSHALHDARIRVHNMMMIHDALYRSSDFQTIDLHPHLSDLMTQILDSFTVSNGSVRIVRDIDNLEMDPDTVFHLGIIVTELVTNSLKYAFPEGRSGSIFLGIRQLEDSEFVECLFLDDGTGFQLSGTSDSSDSTVSLEDLPKGFGLTLVHAMVDQLSARLEFGNCKDISVLGSSFRKAIPESGVFFRLVFPLR
jgi:two-component sensor histidine kinase